MEEKLKEIPDQENQVTYENFETDESELKSKHQNPEKINYLPLTLIFCLIFILFIFFFYSSQPKESYSSDISLQRQCLTTLENKKECKECNPGDKLQDGKCVVNHSFKAVYHTKSDNEKVTLFNLPKEIVTEMIIDNNKIDPTSSYVFPQSGDHTLYALIDMKRCYTLGGLFNGNKNLISIEFSPLFKTEHINEMNFMFQNCKNLKSVDVSNLNTKNVVYMEYMFAGCSSLKNVDVRHFNTENVEKMNSVFQGCSSLESMDLSTWNTKKMKNIEYLFARCNSLTSVNLSGLNTEKVEIMQRAFIGCGKLTSIDVSSFNTKNVRTMLGLFANCTSLEKIEFRYF